MEKPDTTELLGSEPVLGKTPYPLPKDRDFVVIRAFEHIGDTAGVLATLSLLAMAFVMCFEVGARYLFNAPTSWAVEISTYLMVAVVFLGLAIAQASNSHVQVELCVDRLSPRNRIRVELIGQWITLLFVVVIAWQMTAFNVREYINDTRDWGLLSTPQWIPQLPVSVGLSVFALSILVDIYRLKPPPAGVRQWLLPVISVVLILCLVGLGSRNVSIAGTRIDYGTLVIVLAFIIGMLAWSGVRTALSVIAIVGVYILLYWLARGHSLGLVGTLLVVSLMLILLLGVRIAPALGLVGMFGVYFLLSKPQLSLLAERAWTSTNSFTLTAVPMFVLMGGLLLRSGIVSGMFDSLTRWFGRTPGGLAHATAGASAIFAAVSGSSLATAATLGKVACPEMIERGYSPRLTYGVAGAGATLGILIPPSIPMIIYGTTVGASVTHLFIAGIIPGLLLMGFFMAGSLVWALAFPRSAPATKSYSMAEKLSSSKGMLPFIVIIGLVLGSMYMGIATPTESAGIGALSAFLLCLVRGRINLKVLYSIALDTTKVTAMLLLIVIGASIFSWVFDYIRLPRELVSMIDGADLQPWMVIGAVMLAYVVLGMFIESIAMMLMTLPVTFPIAVALGLDPIWFGVFLVLMIEIGLITPPLGMVLFVLRSTNEKARFDDLVYGILPYVVIMLAFVVLIYIYPQIVLWLPQQVK